MPIRSQLMFKLFLLLGVGTTIFCVGCGRKADPVIESTSPKQGSQKEKVKTASKTKVKNSPIHTDKNGHRWLGKVPFDVYEVFYNDVAKVANDQKIIASNTTPTPNTMPNGTPKNDNTPTNPTGSTPKTPTAGKVDWKSLVPLSALENESKELRSALSKHLQSVGTYNKNFLEIQILGMTFSALSHVALEHPDAIRWKKNAVAMRALASEMSTVSDQRGRAKFEKAQILFEKMLSILNGDTPSDLPNRMENLT